MSWTRNSSSVIIIALQKPTFDTATLMSASIGRVLVTRELLGKNNQSINCVDVSWGFRARPKSHFRHTFLNFIVKAIMVYISEILKS